MYFKTKLIEPKIKPRKTKTKQDRVCKSISLLLLDSGFLGKHVFDYLKAIEQLINYIVAVRFYKPIQRIIAGNQDWTDKKKPTILHFGTLQLFIGGIIAE